jgi:dienelactone hydrolase
MMPTQISEYQKSSFSATTINNQIILHDVYQRGNGPPVIIIQELPGIGQATLRLADKLINAGFSVVIPHLFGPIGKVQVGRNLMRVFCLRKEFKLFSRNQSSPIVDWLKALCRSVRDERQVSGVGVIGMCLTGNFAISLMADSSVTAAVSSQPAMPLNSASSLHMSQTDIQKIKINIDKTKPILAFRFENDWMSKQAKFDTLAGTFNSDVERIKMTTLPGDGHSVLTLDFVDKEGHPTYEALQNVIAYFREALHLNDQNIEIDEHQS